MEIQVDISISEEEKSLLAMHSVLNVLNVVLYEMLMLSEFVGDARYMESAVEDVAGIAASLKQRDEALHQVDNIDRLIMKIFQAVETAKDGCDPVHRSSVEDIEKNLLCIFDVLKIRAREIAARAENPDSWVDHDIQQLKNNYIQVFTAIEKNSKGSYKITNNIALQGDEDYFVTFEIDSVSGSTVTMPAVFQDVMRDLIANARKYTPPGGDIVAGLFQSDSELTFVVEDTGLGIPDIEIEKVVKFGYRGSNVDHLPTKGGGFGLTKAYAITKCHGGRMWIERRNEGGTRIRIVIPLPEEVKKN